MVDRLRRAFSSQTAPGYSTSFGQWDTLGSVTMIACHPDWRGVRTASYAFGEPVIEAADLASVADEIVLRLGDAGVRTIVVSGFPDGTVDFIRACRR
ncbi:MAG: hypothetical protein EHM57_06940, partial [Actinobacteria bacterium]